MARENQGLQIALIIFVMLTIILGVTTFLFFRQAEEGNDKFRDLSKNAKKAEDDLRKKQDECNWYKQLMGYAPDSDKDAIQNEFVKQMTPYAALCPTRPDGSKDGIEIDLGDGQKKFLPSFLIVKAQQTKQVADCQTELATTTTDKNKFQTEYKIRQESAIPEIDKLTAARDAAVKQAAAFQADFNKERERFKGDQDKFGKDLQEAHAEGTKKVEDIKGQLDQKDDQIATLDKTNKTIKKDLDAIRGTKKGPVEEHEFPGIVTWVDERRGVVWINLGRADGLQPLTTFSVYPEKPTSITKESSKASIEITSIRGDHEAEARILPPTDSSKLADPIMPRDKIYSPVWSRGMKKHFALAGFMDIDGDGRSDLAVVRGLVTENGGVIDLQIDDKGESQGAISSETNYLVLGTPPDGRNAPKEAVENFSHAVGAAKSNAVKQIKLDEFLQLMGWKQPTNVRRFGAGARPSDTAIKPSENPPRAPAVGGRDDRFRPRTPPPPGAAGAY